MCNFTANGMKNIAASDTENLHSHTIAIHLSAIDSSLNFCRENPVEMVHWSFKAPFECMSWKVKGNEMADCSWNL